jgi:hypothetical protein
MRGMMRMRAMMRIPIRFTPHLLLIALSVGLGSDRLGAQEEGLEFEALESDGDSPPEYVARWYKDHGYDFLILSDHNTLTDPETLAHLVDDGFLLIPGEEVPPPLRNGPSM